VRLIWIIIDVPGNVPSQTNRLFGCLCPNIFTCHYYAAIPILGQDSIFKLFNTIDPLGIHFPRHVLVCSFLAGGIPALFHRMTIIWYGMPKIGYTPKKKEQVGNNIATKNKLILCF